MAFKVKICHNSFSKLDLMEQFAINAFGKKSVEVYDARKGYKKCDILISKGVGHDRSSSALSLSFNHFKHHKRPGAKSIIFNKPIKVKDKINKSFIFYIEDGQRVYFPKKNMTAKRWDALDIKIEPWTEGGDYILFCAQNGRPPFFHKSEDTAYFEWQANFLKELRERVDCRILYRPHPRGRLSNEKISNFLPNIKRMSISTNDDLHDDFLGAKSIITYNSTCSVNAVLNGIPAFVIDKDYITKDITRSSLKFINRRFTPKRNKWFHNFGYCQWSEEEILNGKFWKYTEKNIF